jgi:hypothetical protein
MTTVLAIIARVPVLAWVLAAALAWGGWQRHEYRAATEELLRQQQAEASAKAAALQAQIDTHARQERALQETAHDADISTQRARADAAAAADAARRLRARLANIAADHPPAAAGASAPAGPDAAVLADVLSRCDARAGELAEAADAARIAGAACERAYGELMR